MSDDNEKAILTVRYVNGTVEEYEYAKSHEPGANIAKYIEEALTRGHASLLLKDRAVLIFLHNVLSMEISPSPSQLPGFVIEEVRRISEGSGA